MNDYKNKITSLNLKSKPIFDIEDHLKYTKDWRGQYIGDAIAILKPHDKYEVSKILKFANQNEISIVPQGGNTGLCGGATPLKNSFSIIISTEKMNKIIAIDSASPIAYPFKLIFFLSSTILIYLCFWVGDKVD